MAIDIRAAAPEDRAEALQLLFHDHSDALSDAYVAEMLAADSDGTFPLDDLLVATEDGQIVGVGLLSFAPGRIAMMWPPSHLDHVDRDVGAQLVHAMCGRIAESNAAFGQVLLEIGARAAEVLQTAGLHRAARLDFLTLSLEERPSPSATKRSEPPADDETYVFSSFEDCDPARFATVMEQTYAGSLDCPEISDLRTAEQSLAGHRATGAFSEQLSMLASLNGEDVGVFLASEHPSLMAIEIVYLGVSPRVRGRRLGSRLMHRFLSALPRDSYSSVFLAVDQRNHPAKQLYESFGFERTHSQEVWLYVPDRS